MSTEREKHRLPIKLAVVGHTNTGKTSLIRTLLRNSDFGEVQDSAGTTRYVEAVRLMLNGTAVLELRDTPGMEDSTALLNTLEQYQDKGLRARKCLTALIEDVERHPDFEQEIKVLRQALDCDALFYVVDCRDEVFAKYRHELRILAMAARPILPVLNFVHAPDNLRQQWREALAELGLHASVEFDTVAFDFNAEARLYQKLQTLLEPYYQPLDTLMRERSQQWQQTRRACVAEVATLMTDIARWRTTLPTAAAEGATDLDDNALAEMQAMVRDKEQTCLDNILNILNFRDLPVEFPELPVRNGQWQMDLFAPETFKSFTVDTVSGAATGAAIGAGVDLLLAGFSLGAASATGAALGAAWQTGRRYGRDLLARFRGQITICVDDATLELLALRQLWILRTLFRRGHAAQSTIAWPETKMEKLPPSWQLQLRQLHRLRATRDPQVLEQVKQPLQQWLDSQIADTPSAPSN